MDQKQPLAPDGLQLASAVATEGFPSPLLPRPNYVSVKDDKNPPKKLALATATECMAWPQSMDVSKKLDGKSTFPKQGYEKPQKMLAQATTVSSVPRQHSMGPVVMQPNVPGTRPSQGNEKSSNTFAKSMATGAESIPPRQHYVGPFVEKPNIPGDLPRQDNDEKAGKALAQATATETESMSLVPQQHLTGAFKKPNVPGALPIQGNEKPGKTLAQATATETEILSSNEEALHKNGITKQPGAYRISSGQGHGNNLTSTVETATAGDLILANKVADVEEGERKQIQHQAEQEVLKKWENAAVVADAKGHNEYPSHQRLQEQQQRKRKLICVTCIGVLLLAVGIAVAAALSRGSKQGEGQQSTPIGALSTLPPAPTLPPTLPPTPTLAPTPLPLLAGNVADLDRCTGAFDLSDYSDDPSKWGVPFTVNGTTNSATADPFLAPCGVIQFNGIGVWYRFSISNLHRSRWLVSTCHDFTQYDSQLSVYRGTCVSDASPVLECVAGNDQTGNACTDSSRAVFVAEPHLDYYIYVHGFRQSTGLFQLSLEPLLDNDKCTDALFIDRTEAAPISIFGSTLGATLDDEVDFPTCNSIAITAPGVWYTIKGRGGKEDISFEAKDTSGFDAQFTIFVGDSCSSLRCIHTSNDVAPFVSNEGEIYQIVVHGKGNQQGDFSLNFDEAGSTGAELVESQCSSATEISIGNPRVDNFGAYLASSPNACGNLNFVTGPGIWFKTNGTGTVLRTTTCNTVTDDTQTRISVFGGDSCQNLICIDGNDQDMSCSAASSGGSTVTWFAEERSPYYILVHGIIGREEVFQLDLNEVEVLSSNECGDAVLVSRDGSSILGTSKASTTEVLDVPRCGHFEEWPGVWFAVTGTGERMTASTCASLSSQQTNVVVYTGGCNLLSCVDVMTAPCGQHSSATWASEKDQTYFILVQTYPEVNVGRRQLIQANREASSDDYFYMSVEATVPNDLCANAIGPLIPNDSEIFGSTRSATPEITSRCSISDSIQDTLGRGVWYSALGNGKRLTASTMSPYTKIATKVVVFSGGCNALTCAAEIREISNSLDGFTSWNSVENQLYHILIAGVTTDTNGNFALRLGMENDMCEGATGMAIGDTVSIDNGRAFSAVESFLPDCDTPERQLPGLWYKFQSPDGEFVSVSIRDRSEVLRDTSVRLELFAGRCNLLECVWNAAIVEFEGGTSASWFAESGLTYYILAHGSMGLGSFTFSVDFGREI